MKANEVARDWEQRLAKAIAAAIREYGPRLEGVKVAMFAIDCHPWNGFLGLALLTQPEADEDERLADPAEMAAWKHNDFSNGLSSWAPAVALAREMQTAYDAASEKGDVAAAYLKACSAAVAAAKADGAFDALDTTRRFRISVAHPDDGREFYPPRKRRS